MAEKILIIDDDIDTLKLVGLMLQKQGYQIVAANNGEHGLAQAQSENPDLILLDVMMPEMDGYEVARRLRANDLTANTPILMFTAKTQLDDKVTGFEAGVDDYLTKPTHPTELSAHVKALLARSIKGKLPGPAASEEPHALIIAVLAPRGGQGVTTTAVNLGDALRRASNTETVVAELRPGMGTLGPDLGESNPRLLSELMSAKPSELTSKKVKDNLFVMDSGLRILFGTVQPKDGLLMNNPGQIEALVNRLSRLTSYLVLDLGCGINPLTQQLIPLCDYFLVLVEPIANSVIHSKSLMTDLIELSGNRQRVHPVIVNRMRSDTQLNMSQMEDLLGQSPLGVITPAPELIYQASHMKTTAMSIRLDSLTAQQFTQLSQEILKLEKSRK
jgi:DNA-binding response OmpR family regulator/CO dehydrogenase nickel-insertion accessory protein CooC1